MSYTIIAETLYKQRKYGVLRRCVTSSEILLILKECHNNMVEVTLQEMSLLEKSCKVVIGSLLFSLIATRLRELTHQ